MIELSTLPTIAVFPVLVGPLQTLLALLPAILAGLGSLIFAAFRPAGFKRLLRFCWRQKLALVIVGAMTWTWQSGVISRYVFGRSSTVTGPTSLSLTDWNSSRGGSTRTGCGPGDADPTAPGIVWKNQRDKTLFSSPAVVGDRIIISTATDIGPFSPTGRGAIVCLESSTGNEIWRYSPENYRATFSSPVVQGNHVVCGEGLHQVDDARITCLDVRTGQRSWEFRTKSHVESTAAIADNRVLIGAGDDGFYCLALEPTTAGQAEVVWHLKSADYPDCESSPVAHDGVVYFGLGEGGSGVCAVRIESGEQLWKVSTPYPVFAPVTIADGKLLLSTGNGNFVQSAADLLEMKLQILRDDGATEQQLAEARERLKPVGEVWCLDLATRNVDWKFSTTDAILGAIAVDDKGVYFGSRDGWFYRLSKSGELLSKYELHEPIVAAPGVGKSHVYCSTVSGRLFCLNKDSLKPAWDTSLGTGEMFVSSPTIAHGHVYIGSPESGLLCLGHPGEPDPTLWIQGESGGITDDIAVPDTPEVLWQFPPLNDPPFQVKAPLMLLDGALYCAGISDGWTDFIKLTDQGDDAHRDWRTRFVGRIEAAPVGCGNRILVVEQLRNSSQMEVHCLSTSDGRRLWNVSFADSPSPGITTDFKHVFAWVGPAQLGCFDLKTGAEIWRESTEKINRVFSATNAQAIAGLRGIGLPVSTGDIVFAVLRDATGNSRLRTVDAITSVPLWNVELPERPTGSPMVDGNFLRIPGQEQTAVYNSVDGSFARHQITEKPIAVVLPAECGTAIMPVVAQRGRAFAATDQGKIVCLGAKRP